MPRLLYLCTHPRNSSPSQRYRFEQFEPYLEARGFEVEYSSVLTPDELPIFYGERPAREKLQIALHALQRRVTSVLPRGIRKYDVVLVQRQAFFLFGAWAEWLAHLQAPLVLDFDDAIWIHAVSEGNRRFSFLKNVKKVDRIAELATSVIAGNEYLAAWARRHSRDVHVIPTCVDTERYVPAERRADGPVTIGWCGSPTTIAHLRPVLPTLERVKQKYGDQVRIRVMGDPNFRHEPLDLVGEAWKSDAELRFLQDMHVGLMPLPATPWTQGKCGLKGLTSMACGAPTLMSPVGVNTQIVSDGVNGYLPATEGDWYSTLCRLVDDAGLRARVGQAGRRTVVERYSIERWRDGFANVLLEAASRRGSKLVG